jgi:hypothetical protein
MPESQIKDLPAAPAAIPALAYIPVQMPNGALVKVAVSALGDFDSSITSLLGGEATAFDKVPTVGLSTNTVRRILIGGVLQTYQLRPGQDGHVEPEDYNESTNDRSWYQVVAQFESLVAQAGLSGGGAFSWLGNAFNILDVTTGAANIGIHPIIQGSPVCYHTATIGSGIPGGFASLADHSHLKQRILNPNGPASNTAGWSGQLIYTARTDGTSVHNLHGFESPILFDELGSEHSISTVGGGTPTAPNWTLRIKVRYTVSQASLTVGTKVSVRIDRKVAGIEAAVYAGNVVSANTLNAPGAAVNTYETQIDISGLDANHWNPTQAADVSNQNSDWRILVPQAGTVVNNANKVSLARDTTGPSDRLIATWSTAHGLSRGENVSVLMENLTGLTGGWNGFGSGFVEEVPSTTTALIRVRDLRTPSVNNFAGTAGATSQWAIYRGTLDPDHQVIQPANGFTYYRDATGRTRRVIVGDCDVWTDDEWAIGAGGIENTLRGRRGDLLLGRQSVRTMIGCRAPAGGVRALNDGLASGAVTTVTFGPTIGTGVYTVVAIVQMPPAAPPVDRGVILLNPDVGLHGLFLSDGGNFNFNVGGSSLSVPASPWYGQVVVLEMRRTTTAVELYVNGALVLTHSGTGWDNNLQSTTQLRVGGAYTAAQRYNDVVYRAWLFPHLLTQSDREFIVAHGRIPSELQWGGVTAAHTSDFSAGGDSWAQNMGNAALTTTGNVDGVSGVNDTLRVTNTAGTSLAMQLRRDAILVPGKRYRLTLDYFAETGSGMAFLGVGFHGLKLNTNDHVAVVENSWQTGRTFEFTANSASLFLCIFTTATGTSGGSIAAGKNLYLKNVTLTRLGPTVAHDFGVGVGNQVHDQSGNGYHATLFAPFDHVAPVRNGQVRHSTSTSGNTQIAAGIPANARITGITAWAANPVTLSIGTASGGTQIVNAQSLNLGLQDVALAGRFSVGGTLWVNLSSSIFVRITISYEIIESNV